MSRAEDEVLAVVQSFYDGINDAVRAKGVARIESAWEQTERVTSAHPVGDWSIGWNEILAGFEAFAALGKPTNGPSTVANLQVRVFGDTAYTFGVFTAAPEFGGARLNVTNVLRRGANGWKIVHHHADRSTTMEASAEKIASQG